PLEGGAAVRVHQAESVQLAKALDVDRAPHAALAPRREALRGGVVAQRVADAVDPAETQLLVDGVLPCHRGPARPLQVIAEPQLARSVVVRLEPSPKLGRALEEDDVVWLRHWSNNHPLRP